MDGLQKMLDVCERYAKQHNLKFSTDQNPQKSKTKCLAFLQRGRQLRNLKLCDNILPWVETCKHLGTRIYNTPGSILNRDIREKRAQYIQRNNELMQEFHFAHCTMKAKINSIFNSHFYGSVLWDLFGKEAEMTFNTWNSSIRKMFRLDRRTHRYLIEPLSNTEHIKIALMKRFLNFTDKLSCTHKWASKSVFNSIKKDCTSITGMNLRKIAKLCGRAQIGSATRHDVGTLSYQPLPANEKWRISLIKELIDIRDNLAFSINWEAQDISFTLEHLCTS